jgi:hypothetical protein
MIDASTSRDERIRSLATRLKKNMLSSDEFNRELAALSRSERAALVEFLAAIENGPIEVRRNGSSFGLR